MSFLAGGIPLALVMMVTGTLGKNEISRLEIQRAYAQLSFLTKTFSDFFEVTRRQVETMSKTPTLKSMKWSRIEPYLKSENERSSELFEKFILGKSNGHFFNTKGGNPWQGGIRTFDDGDPKSFPKTIKKRLYWQKTILEDGVYISEPMVSYTTGARQIVISSSIKSDEDKIVGMLGGGISWVEIESLVKKLKANLFDSYGKDVGFSLISKEGVYIFHWDETKGIKYSKDENGHLLLNDIGEPIVTQSYLQDSEDPDLAKAGKSLQRGLHGHVRYKEGREWSVFVYAPIETTPFSLAITIPEKVVLRSLYELYQSYIFISIFAFVIIVFISILVSRRISLRIEKLNNIAKSFIGERVDFDAHQFGEDEIGELARTFQTMSDDIVKSLSQLKVNEKSLTFKRDELQSEVNERVIELREALQKAEEASQAKSDFVANVSHEIRTPLNAVLGLTRLLREEESIPAEHQEHLSIIMSSGEHLLVIINDLLDFSKIEQGEIDLNVEDIQLDEVVKEVCTLMRPSAIEKGIELRLSLDSESQFSFSGDPVRIKQILVNLLSNSIKFTHQGHVHLSMFSDGKGKIKFKLEDTGIGMSEEQCSRVFERFEQAESNTRIKYGGTGLGLAISKKLLEKMNGWISVESTPQKGTVFDFGFLLNSQGEKGNSSHTYQEELRVWAEINRKNTHKALVVDDNSLNLKVAEAVLNKLGLEVETSISGEAAINLLGHEKYDIIFMDNNMPEMDGFEATRRIKNNPKTSSIPIVALTANAMTEDREKNLAAGLDDFLTKPIDVNQLLEVLIKLLKG